MTAGSPIARAPLPASAARKRSRPRAREAGAARGIATLMSIVPEHGVIEIGHIWLSPALQRTRQATEAIHVMARHAFDELGNRRLEWKCDAANAASRRAAERFGFKFEG